MKMEKSYNYPEIWPFLLLVSALTYCVASPTNSSSIMCKYSERKALLRIKQVVGTYMDVESWVGEDCCAWLGVGCDNLTGHIIDFRVVWMRNKFISPCIENCTIEDDSFNNTISALLELKHLTHLDLSGMDLMGPISPNIGSMTHLRYLNITNVVTPAAGNNNVPPHIGNLTNLEVLDLSFNDLTIESLEWASSLSKLQFIDLSVNNLSELVNLNQLPSVSHLILSECIGDIPKILSHSFLNNSSILRSLKYLDLNSNNHGPLPPNLGNLSSLIYLDLSFNSLNGSIPHWLLKLKSLQWVSLEENDFSHVEGGLWGLMNNSCHFRYLDLSFNNIKGEILQPHVSIPKCTSHELDFLDLSNNQIYNTPSLMQLGELSKLSYLDMSHNQIRGTLPSFIGQLKHLKHLGLSSNPIQGTVSLMHIGDLSELSYLDVSCTNLSFDLPLDWIPPFQLQTFIARSCNIVNPPNWLHTQPNIEELDLSNTGMSGEPPNWIFNMSNLHGLNLSYNFLTGPLPKQFASQNLQYLDLNNNDLSGTFPNWLGYLKDADYIDLSSNRFSGSIPLAMTQDCMLNTLLLNDNNLEGIIPPSLGNCTNLVILNLSYNNLSGYIPPWTDSDLQNLRILQLQGNQLGEVSSKDKDDVIGNEKYGRILESLCSLYNLEVLDLQKNKLSGVIPDCWQNHLSLNMINLSSNKLSGRIPCSFGHLDDMEYLHFKDNLEYLHLNDNELHGEIPLCLSGIRGLKILDVGENNLSGLVPSWLNGDKFPELNVLRLSQNIFNGTMPDELCSLSLLRVLDLSNNKLVGNIPACFGHLTSINKPPNETMFNRVDSYTHHEDTHEDSKLIELTHENSIEETIAGIAREYSTNLRLFTTFDLSRNYLEGTIPEELTKLSGLIVLNLSHNHLKGKIPEKIGDMKALETLDLSRNDLCGSIPPSLGNIDSLTHIDFSFNNLSGPIPTTRHMDTLDDPSVYAGNPYLCGDTLPKKCTNPIEQPTTPKVQDNDEVEDKNEKLWFYLVVMLGFATGFWGIIGTLWVKKSWRHAVFRRVEDVYDWVYVGVTLKMSKLKKWIYKENSEE